MLNLTADKKSTFASASAALKWRFPTCHDDMGEWAAGAEEISTSVLPQTDQLLKPATFINVSDAELGLVGCADSVAGDVLHTVSSVDDLRGDGEGERLKEPMDERCTDSAADEVPQAISSGDYSRGYREEPVDEFKRITVWMRIRNSW